MAPAAPLNPSEVLAQVAGALPHQLEGTDEFDQWAQRMWDALQEKFGEDAHRLAMGADTGIDALLASRDDLAQALRIANLGLLASLYVSMAPSRRPGVGSRPNGTSGGPASWSAADDRPTDESKERNVNVTASACLAVLVTGALAGVWYWNERVRRVPLEAFGLEAVNRVLAFEPPKVRRAIVKRGWMTSHEWSSTNRRQLAAIDAELKRRGLEPDDRADK